MLLIRALLGESYIEATAAEMTATTSSGIPSWVTGSGELTGLEGFFYQNLVVLDLLFLFIISDILKLDNDFAVYLDYYNQKKQHCKHNGKARKDNL